MTLPPTSPGTVFDHKDADALAAVFHDIDAETRYNTRSAANEIWVDPPFGSGAWAAFNDRSTCFMRHYVGKNYAYHLAAGGIAPLRFGGDAFADAVNVLTAVNEVDPFEVWLGELPVWDQTPRIDTLLIDLFDAEDTPVCRWASRFLTLGAVQRCFEPGCKLDEMPVLHALQGRGKSALLYELLPTKQHPEWHGDQLDLSDRRKDRTEALLGCVLVEYGELAGVNRGDIASMKAFISRRNDRVRLAYARHPEDLPRRCVIVGTVDRADCLPNDPAGLRRFVVVTLPSGCNVENAIAEVRLQLWAEALHRYQKGERARLPRDLIPQAAAVAEEHRSRDTIVEDAIAAADLTSDDGYTLGRIGEIIGIAPTGEGARLNRAQQMQLAVGLTNAGFQSTRTRRDGRRVSVWTSPEDSLGFGDGASDGF